MIFRKTKSEDIDQIMKIYKESTESLKEDGVDQWQNEGPSEGSLIHDMEMEYSYVLEDEGNIKGTSAVIFDGEKTYGLIFNGEWLNEEEYCTVHRFAVGTSSRKKGIASIMMADIEKLSVNNGFYNIRIDTHEDNSKMRNFLEKSGFTICGKIFLTNGDLRIAYQKVL